MVFFGKPLHPKYRGCEGEKVAFLRRIRFVQRIHWTECSSQEVVYDLALVVVFWLAGMIERRARHSNITVSMKVVAGAISRAVVDFPFCMSIFVRNRKGLL